MTISLQHAVHAGVLIASLTLACANAGAQNFSAPTQAPWGKPADNHILAQKVVNDIMTANTDLVALGLHSIPPGVNAKPGEAGQVIVAQVADRIGAPDGAGDLEVTKQEQVRIYQAKLDGVMRMRVMAPLRDNAGRNIGLAVLLFKLDPGVTALSAHARANAILMEIARRIADRASLFQPVR
jgi:hypothetical protein